MALGWPIACVFEVVGAFLGGELVEELADGQVDGLGGPAGGLAQQVLELGEELLVTCPL